MIDEQPKVPDVKRTTTKLSMREYVDSVSATVEGQIPDQLSDLSEDATHRTVTDTEKSTWNAKAPALGADDNYVTDLEKAKIQQQIIFTYNL